MVVQNTFVSDSRVLREARSLAIAGLRVLLLALEGEDLPHEERVAGFDVVRLHLMARRFNHWIAIPLKFAEYQWRIFAALKRSGARIYHVHDPLPLMAALGASAFGSSKILYDVHELHFGSPGAGVALNRLMQWYEGSMVRFIDTVIMSDGQSRADLFRKVHGYRGRIVFVYNCPCTIDYPHCRRDLRGAAGIPRDVPLVVFSGNIGRHRALEPIVSGMSQWSARAHFVMVGALKDGAENWLLSLARDAGAADRVHFFGPVPPDDVACWLASGDLAVTLVENAGVSYFNSAPTKMFEAIMARLPQIASDFPEMRRVVRDNEVGPVGEVTDPANAGEITATISRLLSDEPLRARYRGHADMLASTRYNWEDQERTLIALYRQMAPGLFARATAAG